MRREKTRCTGKTRTKEKVLTAATELSRLVQSRCRGVKLLNGTGTDGGICDTIITDIKLCSKKSQARANLSASGLMLRKRMTETSKIAPASTGLGR